MNQLLVNLMIHSNMMVQFDHIDEPPPPPPPPSEDKSTVFPSEIVNRLLT